MQLAMCIFCVYASAMIYLIATDDRAFCKIGRSIDPAKRLSALQTAWPRPLALMATRDEADYFERQLHEHLAKFRVRGEWFTFTDEVLDIFNTLVSDVDVDYVEENPPPLFTVDEAERLFGHIESTIRRTIEMIRRAIDEGHSPAKLCRRAGLHRNALYGAKNPDWDPRSSTLEKLERHLL